MFSPGMSSRMPIRGQNVRLKVQSHMHVLTRYVLPYAHTRPNVRLNHAHTGIELCRTTLHLRCTYARQYDVSTALV